MSAEWATRQPTQPASTNQKRVFATVNLSQIHFTQNIQVPEVNPKFCAKTLKLNYNVVLYGAMALRGLSGIYQ